MHSITATNPAAIAVSAIFALASSASAWDFPALPETASAPPADVPACADPRGYPDADGFRARADAVVNSLGNEELGRWRRGYFSGGDPGKYLPGAAMARLMLRPDDEEARKYQNDGRSYKEHYHFAAVNWSRYVPLFGKATLTEDTWGKLVDAYHRYSYLKVGGTENHRTMWMTSANVLPHYLGTGSNFLGKDEALAQAREQLRRYVKGLYDAGAGEWDSSTYTMFTVHGLLNIYDFSPDPECRLLAEAGLDLLVAGYALKYNDGVFTAPNQRGHARKAFDTITDQTGYLWWGGHGAEEPAERSYRYAMHALTSAWRPGTVLCDIACKNLPGLPVEQRDTKANYWYGQQIAPKDGCVHESLWIDKDLTMGSAWDAHASQHTRFSVVAATPKGGVAFTGGHPRKSDHNSKKIELGFKDGTGRYVQSAQFADTYLSMAFVPEDEEADYAYFAYPAEYAPEVRDDGWFVFRAGESVIAVRDIAGKGEVGATPPDKKGKTEPIIRFPGRRTGFFVVVGGAGLVETLPKRVPDTSKYLSDGTVSWIDGLGRKVSATFQPAPEGDCHGSRLCAATENGAPVEFDKWSIYGGPFVRQRPGSIEISNGKDGYFVDFSGDRPVYGKLQP